MNNALLYLWMALLRSRALHFAQGLRRLSNLLAVAAVSGFFGFLYYYREQEVFAQLVRRETLIGGALIMLCGSIFKGFLQRGLVFGPPDIEFLFTSPFSQRQILIFRLLPNYLFSLIQGLAFVIIFATHLRHPLWAMTCLILFQIACFHISAATAIYAGTLPELLHERIRWLLLGFYALLAVLYFRWIWDLRFIPSMLASPLINAVFYPVLTLPDVLSAPGLGRISVFLAALREFPNRVSWQNWLWLSTFGAAAAGSLWWLLQFKSNLFETSLATTAKAADRRQRLQEGRRVALQSSPEKSMSLPRNNFFYGVGAIMWKNLVVARRSKRELAVAFGFTLIYSGFLIGFRWLLQRNMNFGADLPKHEVRNFDLGLCSMLCVLPFILQRTFPFDFRRDGQHLLQFRTLPISAWALALSEIAIPTFFCLAFQALGMVFLALFAQFDWALVLLMLLGFPAVALALNGVWNLHYLLAASKRVGGKTTGNDPVSQVLVVALSFLVFYPAGWAALKVGRGVSSSLGEILAAGTWLVVQYLVNFIIIWMLAELFHRFEIPLTNRETHFKPAHGESGSNS